MAVRALTVLLVMALLGGCRSSAQPPGTGSSEHLARLAGRAQTFLSLWPACACGKRTTLDQFSLTSGKPWRRLVWHFDGVHLRLVASYPANDAAQVLAVPW